MPSACSIIRDCTDSQLISYALPGGARALSYDKVGNITSVSGANLATSFGYDALNRLTAANDASFNLGYSYDANGNRLSVTNTTGTTSYAYATNSNRLLSLAGVTNQTNQYDADGNLTSDGTHSYAFDARNHLVSVDSGNTATYLYNALGQRVQKTALQPGNAIGAASLSTNANTQAAASQSAAAQHVATVQAKVQTTRSAQAQANSNNTANVGGMITTRFAYDVSGNLIGQYDSNGNPEQEIIRLGRLPVAVVQNGQVYDIYTDQRGAPRAIANSSGTVVWSWDPTPFGNTAANDNPDGDHVKFSFNLRFPGQYYDVETGRNYNNFRYYDPSTGRYISSDPIGVIGLLSGAGIKLQGGLYLPLFLAIDQKNIKSGQLVAIRSINTYAYVSGNPINGIDPFGLEEKLPTIPKTGGQNNNPPPKPEYPSCANRTKCALQCAKTAQKGIKHCTGKLGFAPGGDYLCGQSWNEWQGACNVHCTTDQPENK